MFFCRIRSGREQMTSLGPRQSYYRATTPYKLPGGSGSRPSETIFAPPGGQSLQDPACNLPRTPAFHAVGRIKGKESRNPYLFGGLRLSLVGV
jgi:hypothetical protein